MSTWKPEDISEQTESGPAINQLESEYRALKEQKSIVNNMLKEAEDYEKAINGFENQEHEQGLRLETIGIYQKLEVSESPVKDALLMSLSKLNESLSKTTKAKPHLNSRITELRGKRSELAKPIKKAQSMLSEYQKKDEELGKLQNLNLRKAKVIGRISLYLDGIDWNKDTTLLEKQIRELSQRIEVLEQTLDPELLIEKLDSQLNLIGRDMSRWAKELELEHSDCPIKLDLKRLTDHADIDEPWFQDCIRDKKWRGDEALIPVSWI